MRLRVLLRTARGEEVRTPTASDAVTTPPASDAGPFKSRALVMPEDECQHSQQAAKETASGATEDVTHRQERRRSAGGMPHRAVAKSGVRSFAETVVTTKHHDTVIVTKEALSTTPSQHFLTGPEVLSAVDARCLVVGIPRRAEQHPQPEDYVGGIWRPPPRPQPHGKLDACAKGIAAFCATCVTDANGSLALNHERECEAEGSGSIILVGNVDCEPAMPALHSLLNLLLSMAPADAWRPKRMRQLLAAYDNAENALARCSRVEKVFRKEVQLANGSDCDLVGA
mmetsp:Transcript_35226/g.63940  ORF Transcript_35226/g.63940 Transcript_35226/m.63940 type:complete len:284 (-) Transcript_35226:38-889(-)